QPLFAAHPVWWCAQGAILARFGPLFEALRVFLVAALGLSFAEGISRPCHALRPYLGVNF
ncbi:hypothetical protein, partial [Aureimonas ureilytica]|uniref:hypothetical protein n=1 Tax=Aureimonas ureilytica TaxID=401562 RepID=UPI00197A9FA0